MRARKILPLIIIAILLPLALASCEGIGDGALIGNADAGNYLVAEWKFFDPSVTFRAEGEIKNVRAEELFEMLLHGEYAEGLDRVDMDMPYFELKFRLLDRNGNKLDTPEDGSMYDGVHRIYLDGYVLQEISSGTVQKGHLGGVYEKLTAYIPEFTVPPLTQSDEQLAEFAFNRLMIATAPGKNYTASDFPEIDCIAVKSLMSTEEISWWVLTLDSDTEKEILDSLKKLKTRDDIKSVELDYIMTID